MAALRGVPFLALLAPAVAVWNPVPPCSIPPGIVGVPKNESMCFNTIVPAPKTNTISIRQMGLPGNETLITSSFGSSYGWAQALDYTVPPILQYFAGNNDEQLPLSGDTTVPLATRVKTANNTNPGWTSSIMISTFAYPDDFLLPGPAPGYGVVLERVGFRTLGVIQFNTTAFPQQPYFEEACGALTVSLPPGYTINATSNWTPTYVLYNGENGGPGGLWTNECWVEVIPPN